MKIVFEDQELTEEELIIVNLKEGELPPWELLEDYSNKTSHIPENW